MSGFFNGCGGSPMRVCLQQGCEKVSSIVYIPFPSNVLSPKTVWKSKLYEHNAETTGYLNMF